MANRRLITIGVLLLVPIALIGLAVLVALHHRVPEKLTHAGPLIICGRSIPMPAEVGYATGLADGGSMIFGIKDGTGKIHGIICHFGNPDIPSERFLVLKYCEGMPRFDGVTEPQFEEITGKREEVRNFLYYAMKDADFHGSSVERAMAHQLYPNLFQRYVR